MRIPTNFLHVPRCMVFQNRVTFGYSQHFHQCIAPAYIGNLTQPNVRCPIVGQTFLCQIFTIGCSYNMGIILPLQTSEAIQSAQNAEMDKFNKQS